MNDFEYDEESLCDCGRCRYCLARLISEYDDDSCIVCNDAGCVKCEE